jgi:hypothetical protein
MAFDVQSGGVVGPEKRTSEKAQSGVAKNDKAESPE